MNCRCGTTRRNPLTPRAGFSSFGISKKGTGLSLPASIVLTTIGPSGAAERIAEYDAACFSKDGFALLSRYKSSVLNKPTPSAAVAAAATASSSDPMFALTGIIGLSDLATKEIACVASESAPPTTTRSPTGSTRTI